MNAYEIIKKKRDAQVLSDEEIQWFIQNFTNNVIPDYQAAALLMAIFINDMNLEEILALTKTMWKSGKSLKFNDPTVIDKHSTGGVGDKTSFITGPIAASCGVKVPMISGRGLGHTGGTADKIESIPGYKTNIPFKELPSLIQKNGMFLVTQTDEIAPADKKLYALRDVTTTVNSVPLITASIMSKKLAEGISGLVIDVKQGSGAFMNTADGSHRLAHSLTEIGKQLGIKTIAFITNMDFPLGNTVGHSLEIIECIETLKGNGPKDLEKLSLELAAGMIFLAGKANSLEEGKQKATQSLHSGAALKKFVQLVKVQGGEDILSNPDLLTVASETYPVRAKSDGYIESFESDRIGRMLVELKGGRKEKEDKIDSTVGFKFLKKPGDTIQSGEVIFNIYHHLSQKKIVQDLEEEFFTHIMKVSQSPPPQNPLIYKVLSEKTGF